MILRIKEKNIPVWSGLLIAVLLMLTMGMAFGGTSKAALKQKTFSSAGEAVKAAVTAAKNNDDKELIALFGPSAKELIFSGDAVADKQRREQFIRLYDEKYSLVPEKESMVIVIGKHDWPFPIPIAKKGDAWFFDTDKGKDEILNRRVGANELDTIQTMLAIVDAQREYAMFDRDNNGINDYAQNFRSDQGKNNGLYWKTKEGEDLSPLGEFMSGARFDEYAGTGAKQAPVPYHGYYFRILRKQGGHAIGGKLEYLVKNKMIGGFAVVASPAKYGNSGVMTFIVNHDGIVYEKDLGKNTAKTVKAIKAFDPDKTWKELP
ncbi:MAG: DUF2950 domain-containing protein [Nitrospirae bacterium]|nr:DUF2950 domain-containing protein [Nitrospirota bacterium]